VGEETNGDVATGTAPATKQMPRSNAVKIDPVSGGLIVDGLGFFPFGFYCSRLELSPSLPEEEFVRGFNMISPYQKNVPEKLSERRKYMDRCAELGMKVNYHLNSFIRRDGVWSSDAAVAKKKLEGLKAEVLAFRDHPALLSWYISDEPAGRSYKPADMAEIYKTIKELDPYHPITIVFVVPGAARRFAEATDVVMADIYPIPNDPPVVVGDETIKLVKEFHREKPVWIVPQAFGGNEWWPREPTPQEERLMTYLAVIHGATGIQYFVRQGLNQRPKSTAAWAECGAVALEVAELTPVLLSHEPRPRVSASLETVRAGAWLDRGIITILAANTVNQPETVRFILEGIDFTGKAQAIFENRSVDVVNGEIEDMIDAYGTRAYQITIGPLPEEKMKIHPCNKTVNPSFENNPNPGTPAGCYADVGPGRGATHFVDSRVAVHGRHSLRLHMPTRDEPVGISPFPVSLKKGQSYRCSVWAKGVGAAVLKGKNRKPKPAKFELSFPRIKGETKRTFTLTDEWQRYRLLGTAEKDTDSILGLSMVTPGTGWFDLLEVVAEPAIWTDEEVFIGRAKVSISTDVAGGEIRYTIDGSKPNADSRRYESPFTLNDTATVKAVVFKNGQKVSSVNAAAFKWVELRAADNPDGVTDGITYAYYISLWWSKLPAFDELEPAKTGTVSNFTLSPRTQDQFFGMKFTGFISVPRDGIYTFFTTSDDGSKLFIGEQEVVDNDGWHGMKEASGQIALEAGLHAVTVLFFQNEKGVGLKVRYSGPGIEKQEIPDSALWH